MLNSKYFAEPLGKFSYLSARGFSNTGKSGGIRDPREVEIPKGTVLFRLYDKTPHKLGEWWFSPHEMLQVVNYFARTGAAFAAGRETGQGILHAVFAIRHEWGWGSDDPALTSNPDQLRRFVVMRLTETLKALYGEGDDAPSRDYSQLRKPIWITDDKGVRRLARQIFLPKPWEYRTAFADLGSHSTDGVLIGAVRKWRRTPLPFEV